MEYFGLRWLQYDKDSAVSLFCLGGSLPVRIGPALVYMSTCLKASWFYWLTFSPSVRANANSRVSVFVQGWFPGSRSALWDGGQATRWRPDSAVRSQNDHCSVASPHVASRRVKTSCLLTTIPKQSPLLLDHICCTSAGSTHCAPTRLYLNSFFFFF